MGVSSLLPSDVRRRLAPLSGRIRLALHYCRAPHHRLYYDRHVLSWVAVRPVGAVATPLVVRSYRELRRWHNLERSGDATDLVYRCLAAGLPVEVFYDVGASNGIYGFAAHALCRSKVVFVEPYTPSIESILKTTYVTTRAGAPQGQFEIVHAAIDREESFRRLTLHGPPIAGETRNTYADPRAYAVSERRTEIAASQWIKGVSLDSLVYSYGLPVPTLVKIDVDGFEVRAIEGARRLIADQRTEAFIVEWNRTEDERAVGDALAKAGYVNVCHQRHYPSTDLPVGDWLYVRADRADLWRARLGS